MLSAWDQDIALTGKEVLFESAIRGQREQTFYRKLIPDNRKTVTINGGEPISKLKPTGKWIHEDDFGTQWVGNDNRKEDIAVVRIDDGLIGSVKDVYDRSLGKWR